MTTSAGDRVLPSTYTEPPGDVFFRKRSSALKRPLPAALHRTTTRASVTFTGTAAVPSAYTHTPLALVDWIGGWAVHVDSRVPPLYSSISIVPRLPPWSASFVGWNSHPPNLSTSLDLKPDVTSCQMPLSHQKARDGLVMWETTVSTAKLFVFHPDQLVGIAAAPSRPPFRSRLGASDVQPQRMIRRAVHAFSGAMVSTLYCTQLLFGVAPVSRVDSVTPMKMFVSSYHSIWILADCPPRSGSLVPL